MSTRLFVLVVAAFAANVVGTRPQPLFRLEVERLKPGAC
jgi:hypothetical protein